MITIDITFTASPSAIGGYLEYRYVLPDATFSPWQVNLNLGNTQGYFPITSTTVTFTNVIANLPDWQYNTTYQFRLRQVCGIDQSEQLSEVDGDYYVPFCPSYTTSIGDFNTTTASYPIYMDIPTTIGQSVVNYTFYIYDAANPAIPLAQITEPSSRVNPGPYQFVWDDSNVPGGIQMDTSYLVSLSYSIYTSNMAIVVDCEPQGITPPSCNTYYIETGDSWVIDWTDCSGVPHTCYIAGPYNGGPGWNACRSNFLLCSLTIPIGYICRNGQLTPGFTTRTNTNCPTGTQVAEGALVRKIGNGCTGNNFTDQIIYSVEYGSTVVPCSQCSPPIPIL